MSLWTRVKDAAIEKLESGRRAAKVIDDTLAQFLAIRDYFADQWQPTGGIESAMIDMLAVAFSLQMYWSTIGHQRALPPPSDTIALNSRDLAKSIAFNSATGIEVK